METTKHLWCECVCNAKIPSRLVTKNAQTSLQLQPIIIQLSLSTNSFTNSNLKTEGGKECQIKGSLFINPCSYILKRQQVLS
jgi:hypothetical protein